MKNRICELLSIRYPILCGAMQWISKAELAAAVSNAGGLGILSATTHPDAESLAAEIRHTRAMTDKPFAVNISMLPQHDASGLIDRFFDTVIQERVPIVETSGRSPEKYIDRLHREGIKVLHKVPALRFAKKAESIGADAVTLVGFECGGHPGLDDVTTLALIPRAARELSIPVLAGGGIADSHGFAAMLSLGADGVVLGTRFLLSEECPIHPNFKKAFCSLTETGTKMVQYSIRNPLRAYHNDAVDRVLEMERRGASLEELMTVIRGANGRRCWEEGDLSGGVQAVGQCVGQIHEIKTVREIIDEMVSGARDLFEKNARIFDEK